jgi:hypothetical protein
MVDPPDEPSSFLAVISWSALLPGLVVSAYSGVIAPYQGSGIALAFTLLMKMSRRGGMEMKKKVLIVAISALLLSLTCVPFSYAGYNHGYYRHGYHGGDGYYVAGALVGGLLLGTVIGSAVNQPRYVAPAPVYVYPASARAYGYPSYGPAFVREEPPGVWVTVPGQWVNGRWIPAHSVWTRTNPY